MSAVYDRVKMNTATAGTGTITLGTAESGYRTFADASVPNLKIVSYVIEDGTAWEIGTGTYTVAGTTLSRTLVSSSTGALLNLSGSAKVYISPIKNNVIILDNGTATVAGALATSGATGTISATALISNTTGGTLFTGDGAGVGHSFQFIGAPLIIEGNTNATATVTFRPNGTGVYSNFIMKGTGNSTALGLDILSGDGFARFSADTFVFRNAAQTTTFGNWTASGLDITTKGLVVSTAGTTTAAPLKIKATGAAVLTTPVEGTIETDGTNLYWTNSAGTRAALANSGASTANVADAQVDFGTTGLNDYATVTVAAGWVAATSNIMISPLVPTTADHDVEDALLEGLTASVQSITAGVSFVLGVHAPSGTWGRYDFACLGV